MDRMMTYDQRSAEVIIRSELEFLQARIIANILRNGQNATGKTIASLHVETSPSSGTLYGRSYFGTLETGRRPGRVPSDFAAIILRWMQAKNIHADDGNDKGMANAIVWAIKRKGSKLFREGGRKDVFSNEIPAARARIMERFTQFIKSAVVSQTEQIRKEYKFK